MSLSPNSLAVERQTRVTTKERRSLQAAEHDTHLVWTEVEIPELPCLQVVRHVRGLLLGSKGVLPDVHPPAPPHRQQTPLADVAPGGRARGEVGMQRLIGPQVPDLHLPIRPCRHHVVTCRVYSQRQDRALHTHTYRLCSVLSCLFI